MRYAELRDRQVRLAIHRIGQGDVDRQAREAAVGYQLHPRIADKDWWQVQQGRLAVYAAVVEPVEVVHRHAVPLAPVVNLDLQAVGARPQLPRSARRRTVSIRPGGCPDTRRSRTHNRSSVKCQGPSSDSPCRLPNATSVSAVMVSRW